MVIETKCLPISLVPESLVVTTMRDNMVDEDGSYYLPTLYALYTERMLAEIPLAGLLPPIVITTLRRTTPPPIPLPPRFR